MEYLITFEDGSSGYLAHYGVKGMKWGVWNEETARRNNAGGSQKFQQRKKDMAAAAKSAAISASVTAIRTGGNPTLTIASFATSYASNRIAQHVVRKGKPVIDKLVKNEENRKWVEWGARSVTSTLINTGISTAGSAAVNALVGNYMDAHYTPTAHSLPGNLVGVNPKPHGSVSQPSSGISSQLSNANIPQSLKGRR